MIAGALTVRARAAALRRADHGAGRDDPGRDPRRSSGGSRPSGSMGVLFITHDLDLAAAVCDRVYVMYAGRDRRERLGRGGVRRARSTPTPPACWRRRPDLSGRPRRLVPIPGAPLSLLEKPSGCSFASRCAYAVEACASRGAAAGRRRRRARGPVPARPRELGRRAAGLVAPGRGCRDERAGTARGHGPAQGVRGAAAPSSRPSTESSFTLAAGGSVGLVGESGSGKTTTARMLVGLEVPDAGTILVGGHAAGPAAAGSSGPAGARPGGPDRLPGPVPVPGPEDQGRGLHRRRCCVCTPTSTGPAARRRVGELLGQVGLGDAGGRGAAASALGRSAPTRRDRSCARGRAAGARPRRGGVGPRRLGAGTGPEPARRHPAADRRRAGLRQPRPGRGALRLRRRRW